VRVPNHDAQWMSRVLDGGAQGVSALSFGFSSDSGTAR
jgi:hypothetical protein